MKMGGLFVLSRTGDGFPLRNLAIFALKLTGSRLREPTTSRVQLGNLPQTRNMPSCHRSVNSGSH